MIGIDSSEKLQENILNMLIDYFKISRDDIVENNIIILGRSKSRDSSKTLYSDVEVNRIEYKSDFRMKSNSINEEQEAIQDILRIASDSYKGYEKQLYKYTNRTNCIYCKNSSDYISVLIYFKEYERLEDEDFVGAKTYKNIVRTELKLKNQRLNYEKRYRKKTLPNYFNYNIIPHFFSQYITPLFSSEPFFRLDVAIAKINATPNNVIKKFMKPRLIDFLTKINEVGYTEVQKNYNFDTLKKYKDTINSLGINILTFSKIINNKEISLEKIDNFTLLQNGIEEDI